MPRNPGKTKQTGESSAFTYSGLRVDLVAPAFATVFAVDLAEHLSKQAMYRGATRGLYTAAQHCAIVAGEVVQIVAFEPVALAGVYALLHHAERAYSDNPTYAPQLRAAVHQAFGLEYPAPEPITVALVKTHLNVELTELRQLCTGCEPEIADLERRGAVPLKFLIRPLGWDRARDRFIEAVRTYAKAAGIAKRPAFGDLL